MLAELSRPRRFRIVFITRIVGVLEGTCSNRAVVGHSFLAGRRASLPLCAKGEGGVYTAVLRYICVQPAFEASMPPLFCCRRRAETKSNLTTCAWIRAHISARYYTRAWIFPPIHSTHDLLSLPY